jgi:3-dehydroquinate dehydratase
VQVLILNGANLDMLARREEWRRFSVVQDIASHRVIGKGPDGYREALEFLVGKVEA